MMSDIFEPAETDDWSEDGSPFLVEQALAAMIDGPDELVWFVDPETYDVLWGNVALREALARRADLTLPRVSFARMFPDEAIAARWRTLYEETRVLGASAARRVRCTDDLEVEATLVAVHRRNAIVGLAVFAKPLLEDAPPA